MLLRASKEVVHARYSLVQYVITLLRSSFEVVPRRFTLAQHRIEHVRNPGASGRSRCADVHYYDKVKCIGLHLLRH